MLRKSIQILTIYDQFFTALTTVSYFYSVFFKASLMKLPFIKEKKLLRKQGILCRMQ